MFYIILFTDISFKKLKWNILIKLKKIEKLFNVYDS